MNIKIEDIENILEFEIDSSIKERFEKYNFNYDLLTEAEMNDYLVNVVNVLTNDIVRSGEHRINEWESGWGENLTKFKLTKDINDLVPRYHSKNKYVRWNKQIVKPQDVNFDYNIHTIFIDSILKHYFNNVDSIFEFGCGPGYHLLRLKDIFTDKNLYGSDWTVASQELIKEINNVLNTSINSFNLNVI